MLAQSLGFILLTSIKNAFRQKTRTILTVIGLAVAILAFGLLQTVITAWYSKATSASTARLVTRNATSLVFDLPVYFKDQINGVRGVKKVAYAQWFGGVYKKPKNFFPQFAVSKNYLEVYRDFVLNENDHNEWRREKRGAIVGRQIANRFDFKKNDVLRLKGTLYPGSWDFIIKGIYDGIDETKVTDRMFFHWDYLNSYVEKLPKGSLLEANNVGVFISSLDDSTRAASISLEVDEIFKNSIAPTFTETEQAFQLGFVAMSDQIIEAIRLVSYVIVLIILAVMANTMAMSVRERTREFATMRALGFSPQYVSAMIVCEAVIIAIVGGGIGILLTNPSAYAFQIATDSIFPVFIVTNETIFYQSIFSILVGVLASSIPAVSTFKIKIIDGIRSVI